MSCRSAEGGCTAQGRRKGWGGQADPDVGDPGAPEQAPSTCLSPHVMGALSGTGTWPQLRPSSSALRCLAWQQVGAWPLGLWGDPFCRCTGA